MTKIHSFPKHCVEIGLQLAILCFVCNTVAKSKPST